MADVAELRRRLAQARKILADLEQAHDDAMKDFKIGRRQCGTGNRASGGNVLPPDRTQTAREAALGRALVRDLEHALTEALHALD